MLVSRSMAIAIFILVIGILTVYAGIDIFFKNRKWSSFEKTLGRILTKKIAFKSIASSSGPSAKYRIVIRYKYSVNGQKFENDKFYSIELDGGEVALSESDAMDILSNISDEMIIFYNKENPQQSFIMQISQLAWIFLLIGFILLITGLLIFI